MKYDKRAIALELQKTALGNSYYGNALRVAKDLPETTPEERSLLDRWATGRQSLDDGWELQRLAIKMGIIYMTPYRLSDSLVRCLTP